MPPPSTEAPLLNRSPRSRKSLAVAGHGLPAAALAKRKRAHSIAPGENLKLDASRRRSLLRPTKGILKPSNQADQTQDATQDVTQAYQTLDTSDMTTNGTVHADFQTDVHDNPSRKSLGGRRVSFAAHAHVRVFDTAEQNTNGTSSPTSSPPSASAPTDSPPVSPLSPNSPSQKPPQPHLALAPQSPSRLSSVVVRRRSSVHELQDDGGAGEESMDVSADEIPPPAIDPRLTLTSFQPQAPDIDSLPSGISIHDHNTADSPEDDEESDEGDMSMTGDFGPGIVSRRRTMSMAGPGLERRKSRLRSSITIPPAEGGTEQKEFTVSLDRPPPPESDAFKALKEMANGDREDHGDDTVASEYGEVDMDVTTAMTRLMAVRNSTGGQFPVHNGGNDSFSSIEDSFDGVDNGDRTMNVTNLMASFRTSDHGVEDDGDINMSATSVVGVITTHLESAAPSVTAPPPSASLLPLPVFTKSSTTSSLPRAPSPAKPTASRPVSPAKQPIKQFTAAFAPPHQAPKRPLSVTASPHGLASPNKRRAVPVDDASTGRISVPVPSVPVPPTGSPRKIPSKARRPSGYYRKSLAGASAPDTPAASGQHPSSEQQRRQSARPASPRKAVVKPPPFIANPKRQPESVSSNGACVREDRRQSLALPSPTRGSPSPVAKAHYVEEVSSPDGVLDEEHAENVEDAHVGASAFSPPLQSIDPEQWASAVHTSDAPQDDELAPISVDQFFSMTGIRFMDDLTCPRRSVVHPSQLQRRESQDGEDAVYPFSDYVVAMTVDVAQLETMTWIANDIRSAIEKYKAHYRETEEDAAKDTPFLFREYATASEEDREQILYVLKLIKAHTILSAKASWYEWKRGWVQDLQMNAERALDNLDADERQLADIAARAEQTLPGLRSEYEEIMRELEEEKAAVAEIEECDQTFLSELKATIAEQKQELDVYRNDLADGNTKLARLEETLEDLDDQAREARTAITTAQRQMAMQKTSTRAEVFRLRDELDNLQDLHLWRAIELSADMVMFIYDSKYKVTIPCRRFSPIPEAIDISPFSDRLHDNDKVDFPVVTELMYRIARHRVIQDHDIKLNLRIIIQRLTDFWASYDQLRWQLSFIIIKYPVSFQLIPANSNVEDAKGFMATATLLLFKGTSKALVTFHFDSEVLSTWPMTLESLKYDVSVVYGKADPNVLNNAIKTRLSEASVAENHACLVDACMEVVSRYS